MPAEFGLAPWIVELLGERTVVILGGLIFAVVIISVIRDKRKSNEKPE